jgi:hypothetical protein
VYINTFLTHDLMDPQETLVCSSVLLSPSDYCINLEFLNYLLMFFACGLSEQLSCTFNPHRVQRSIRGDCYVKRGVSVSKRLISEHGKFICICSNKGTESDQRELLRR